MNPLNSVSSPKEEKRTMRNHAIYKTVIKQDDSDSVNMS